jgi:TonB-linked SusC/RagA family outer membrane protein
MLEGFYVKLNSYKSMKKNDAVTEGLVDSFNPIVLKIMKISFFLLLVCTFSVNAAGYSQTRISISADDASIRNVLREIESKSDYTFFYNEDFIDLNKKITYSADNKAVVDVLETIADKTGLEFKVLENNLVVITKEANINQTVTGTVTDEKGITLPGVSIQVDGTTIGTVTDVNGKYSIELPGEKGVLVFSFIGYTPQKIEVQAGATLNVKMVMEAQNLDEVIVVGYGTMKKSDVVTSVTSVKADKLTRVATTNVGEMLRGKVSGVQVTTSDNGPGGTSILQIRGKGSVKARTTPLIIADGIEIGAINDINPDDIASVEILKDAASQAIYGARASNGVVLITTKRGKSGKTNVDYSAFYGWQKVQRFFDVYSPEEYIAMKKEGNIAIGLDPMANFTETEKASIANNEYIDWEKEITRTASMSNHNLSISGGTDKTTAFLGMNFQNTNGVVYNTNFKKGSVRLNVDQVITKWAKIGTNISYQVGQNNGTSVSNGMLESVRTSPLGRIYNDDGSWRISPTSTTAQENKNPVVDIYNVDNVSTSQNDIESFFVDFTPVKGLMYEIKASRRSWNLNETSFSGTQSIYGLTNNGLTTGRYTRNQSINWYLDNIVTYNTQKGKHNFGGTFVQSVQQGNNQKFEVSPSQMPDGFTGIYNMGNAIQYVPALTGSQRRLVSFMGRLQYDYDSKYYINVTARADGSSVFGNNNKWGYFPSIALAWNMANEEFLKSFEPLSLLKIRFSYGSVGNEGIDPYQSLALAKTANYLSSTSDNAVIGYVAGSAKPNPDLKWEESATANLAVEFGFFKNRLNGVVELYNTKTKDLLIDRALNSSTGYTTQKQNLGEVENKGIELQLDGMIVRKQDFTVQAGITFSKNMNQITHLYGDVNGDGVEDDDATNSWFIGQPIDVTWRWEADGIFQEGEVPDASQIALYTAAAIKPGMIKVKDQNGDDKINDLDKIFIDRTPDWMGSFFLNAAYKGVDFTAEINTVQGVQKINQFLSEYTWGGDLRGVFNGVKVDYWTPQNPTGTFPRPNAGNTPANIVLLNMQDASYFRIGTVSLGYSFPKTMLSKVKLTKLRGYVTAHNPYTSTKFQAFSPERTADENNGNQPYPESQTLIIGLQVSF